MYRGGQQPSVTRRLRDMSTGLRIHLGNSACLSLWVMPACVTQSAFLLSARNSSGIRLAPCLARGQDAHFVKLSRMPGVCGNSRPSLSSKTHCSSVLACLCGRACALPQAEDIAKQFEILLSPSSSPRPTTSPKTDLLAADIESRHSFPESALPAAATPRFDTSIQASVRGVEYVRLTLVWKFRTSSPQTPRTPPTPTDLLQVGNCSDGYQLVRARLK